MRIKVSISEQRLYVLKNTGERLKTYIISTSGFGLGSEPDSNFTPLGRFRIVQKIGHGAPHGTIFRSRRVVG
ncbi:MAG: murein L,D-transpeptidase, partial [Verrucomicrobiaceae bacterium]